MLTGLQAITFDLDDTLYPEESYVYSGFRAVACELSRRFDVTEECAFDELCQLHESGVRGNTFDCWLTQHQQFSPTNVELLVRVYRDHDPTIQLPPRMRELLSLLRSTYQLGIVSDGFLAVQQRKLAALGVKDQFDAVVFSDQWGRECWKPSTRPFLSVLERLGTPAEATVYVGDNPTKDFLGARRLGMRTICARWFHGMYAHLSPPTPEHAADVEVASLEALVFSINQCQP